MLTLSPATRRRHRAEDCERLTIACIRPAVAPGDTFHHLPDGTPLALRWHTVRGCYGGREGQALLIACPCCDRSARVLWRPPAGRWGCLRCCPVLHRSQRRPGADGGQLKPAEWIRQQIIDEQDRVADLLGLARDQCGRWGAYLPLLWKLSDLRTAPRRPDAARLSARRRDALERRLDALQSMYLLAVVGCAPPEVQAAIRDPEPLPFIALARWELQDTAWAMRRTARDPRSSRTERQWLIAKRPECP